VRQPGPAPRYPPLTPDRALIQRLRNLQDFVSHVQFRQPRRRNSLHPLERATFRQKRRKSSGSLGPARDYRLGARAAKQGAAQMMIARVRARMKSTSGSMAVMSCSTPPERLRLIVRRTETSFAHRINQALQETKEHIRCVASATLSRLRGTSVLTLTPAIQAP